MNFWYAGIFRWKCFSVSIMLCCVCFRIWPLDDTSNGNKCTFHPFSSMSPCIKAYLSFLNKLVLDRFLSRGQVSSRSAIVLDCLDSMTKSGLGHSQLLAGCHWGWQHYLSCVLFGHCTLQGLLVLLSWSQWMMRIPIVIKPICFLNINIWTKLSFFIKI